jgi:general secretion pathway protein L
MSLLVILLPAPPRADATPAPDDAPLAWWLSPDGLAISRQGLSAPSGFARADTVVAVAPAGAVAWHRPVMPKAPANRLRAALGGLLEEQLLADDDDVHLALAPKPVAGSPVWVAALHKAWLSAQLARLAAAQVSVDRLVPALAPLPSDDPATGSAPVGHFFSLDDAAGSEHLQLAIADAEGAVCLPLAGGLARSLLPAWVARGARWSATPATATAAERWVGAPVDVRAEADRALAAARSPWNLLQFDLAPQRRASLALGQLGKRFMSPAWAPARWGLAALLAAQVVGLNVMAWQQQRALGEQRAGMESLLRSTHPQVRAVLDAPVQMQRETAALRVAAGVPGDDDFEPLLAAAAAAWPDGVAPAAQIRFEPGKLSVSATGWQPAQIEQLRQRLQLAGCALDQADGRLVIRRADAPARS